LRNKQFFEKVWFRSCRYFVTMHAFPIRWEEPFGLVMIEAMACGTPVVAFNRGSAPEVIKHGETGFIAKNYREFVSYVKRVDEIDPHAYRRWVEKKFSIPVMTDGYERVYRKVVKSGCIGKKLLHCPLVNLFSFPASGLHRKMLYNPFPAFLAPLFEPAVIEYSVHYSISYLLG